MAHVKTKILVRVAVRLRTVSTSAFKRTRDDHASETAEDYVEAVAEFLHVAGECRVSMLAKKFGVSHVTASRIVRRLDREGLLVAPPRKPIQLSPKGLALAKRSRARHELVFAFLRALGVSKRTAEIDAEGIEHHVSQETLRHMKKFMSDS